MSPFFAGFFVGGIVIGVLVLIIMNQLQSTKVKALEAKFTAAATAVKSVAKAV